jgi:hypothetical protein
MELNEQKEAILEKLSQMSVDELDKLRDEKQLELKGAMKKLYIAKDNEMTTRHQKRNKFLAEGKSLGKAEQALRADEELFQMKKLVMALSNQKKQLELTIEIITSYYWKART